MKPPIRTHSKKEIARMHRDIDCFLKGVPTWREWLRLILRTVIALALVVGGLLLIGALG